MKAQVSLKHLFRVFTKPEDEDSALTQIEKHLSDDILDFLSQHVVTRPISLEDIEKVFSATSVPESPEFVSDLAEHLREDLVAHSVNTYSPKFIGHMTSALPYFHLSLAKLLVGLNQNPVKIETSKAFTPLERQVLGMLHHLIFDQQDAFYDTYLHSANHALGAFCSGGTVANITALWVARNRRLGPSEGFSGVGRAGLHAAYRHYGIQNLGLLSSRRGHYSLGKAIDLLGIGREQMLTLPCPGQTLDPEMALKAGKAYQDAGNDLLALVGVAGTTETGHIDPLDELADVAKELGCWFHVDAAWGGATLFSTSYRDKLSGIEKADSVTMDAHKQMYVPMGAGMVLFKQPESANAVRHHAQYILRQGSKDLGSTTLEGSRNGMAMMVYASLRIFGRQGYQLLIDQCIEKAQLFADMIQRHPDFELITQPTLSILTYRVIPEAAQQRIETLCEERKVRANALTDVLVRKVQKAQREAGQSFVSRTRLEVAKYGDTPITVFRVVLANPMTSNADLAAILAEQRQIAVAFEEWDALNTQDQAD
ncbi:putative pyridoxal-dependent aspartate 1-decarboxylase [Alteromonas sediminis]|uniref:Putative pyridoxal-dependent aspartate 1-decarboxylase n=1 Tax=Alteromonas sediminis TaxID=2259342 RepID=A0A3N5XWQ2_9ALTE|nr:putative pyridoxal-dependent aspartate 1-decarboxylase [Alteromonas sediminis]RPJ64840.1 putative pyridoxal-dependent aspartate 1-decarboxylase [Alteromonas sediminis]